MIEQQGGKPDRDDEEEEAADTREPDQQVARQAGAEAGQKAGSRAGRRAGKQSGAVAGEFSGRDAGESAGRVAGAAAGREAGAAAGRTAGLEAGREAGAAVVREEKRIEERAKRLAEELAEGDLAPAPVEKQGDKKPPKDPGSAGGGDDDGGRFFVKDLSDGFVGVALLALRARRRAVSLGLLAMLWACAGVAGALAAPRLETIVNSPDTDAEPNEGNHERESSHVTASAHIEPAPPASVASPAPSTVDVHIGDLRIVDERAAPPAIVVPPASTAAPSEEAPMDRTEALRRHVSRKQAHDPPTTPSGQTGGSTSTSTSSETSDAAGHAHGSQDSADDDDELPESVIRTLLRQFRREHAARAQMHSGPAAGDGLSLRVTLALFALAISSLLFSASRRQFRIAEHYEARLMALKFARDQGVPLDVAAAIFNVPADDGGGGILDLLPRAIGTALGR